MLDNSTWSSQLRRRFARDRVPVSGTIALTNRCNLGCVHCYLGKDQDRVGELTTDQVLGLLDEITAAGCLSLLLTGGEPLLRTDFPAIYRHARRNGLLVTVFSNATLVTEEIADLFHQYPPLMVEVSLYGASPRTCDLITGVPGSFQRCLRGVQLLLDHEVRTGLKTVIMSHNLHEVAAMRSLARQLGLRFRTDAALFPQLSDGDRAPLELRVPAEQAVAVELADPDRLQEWVTAVSEPQTQAAAGSMLYRCGAGVTNFHIDPQGYLSPCLMTTHERQPISGQGFLSLWSNQMARLRQRTARAGYRCNSCEVAETCGACPAFNLHDTGAEDLESEYLCATSRARMAMITAARQAAATREEPAHEC